MRLFLIAALIIPILGHGQDKGYLVKDSIYTEGFIKIKRLNKPGGYALLQKAQKTVMSEFPLESISEFGLSDGRKFVKRTFPSINPDKAYFFTILIDQPFKVYSLPRRIKKGAIVEKDSTSIRLTRSNYRSALLRLSKASPVLSDHVRLLSFNAKSFRRLAALETENFTGLFPRVRMGITFGYSSTDISIQTRAKTQKVSGNDVSPFFGIFVDTPIAYNPKWFANLQVAYQTNSYAMSIAEAGKQNKYQVNTSTLRVPLMIKYSSTSPKFRYFAVAGPTLDFNIKRENIFYSVTTGNTGVSPKENIDDSIESFLINATVGVGVEYSVTLKNAISVELRRLNSLGAADSQSISAFQLSGSLCF